MFDLGNWSDFAQENLGKFVDAKLGAKYGQPAGAGATNPVANEGQPVATGAWSSIPPVVLIGAALLLVVVLLKD